jgi:pyruvate kinase
MVAIGDLGAELPIEEVPLLQVKFVTIALRSCFIAKSKMCTYMPMQIFGHLHFP